ncbi:hypothetical protein EDB83DRAFT_427837 [Lactarius deliciosus]|nr:hypothetical protein EDB83DRAFT_427837 [Lactarius deliciosus]
MELLSVLCMCISKRFIGPLSRPASRSMTAPKTPATPPVVLWRRSQVLFRRSCTTTCDALTTARTTLCPRSLCGDAHRDRSQITIGRVKLRYIRPSESAGLRVTHDGHQTWKPAPDHSLSLLYTHMVGRPRPSQRVARHENIAFGDRFTLRFRGQTHGPTVLLTGSCAGGDQPPMTRAANTKKALIGRRRRRKDSLMLLVCFTPVRPLFEPSQSDCTTTAQKQKETTLWG